MLNIVHLSSVHKAFDQRVFHRECVTLANAGHRVTLIACHDKDEVKDGVHVKAVAPLTTQQPGLHLLQRRARTRRAYQMALKEKADIYHFHDAELIGVGLKLKRRGAKVIFDCHEDNPGYAMQKHYLPYFVRVILAKSIHMLEKYAAPRFSAVIAADQGVADRFVSFGANTRVVYNFPRIDLFLASTKTVEKEYDLVYHGTIPKYHLEKCFAIDDELVKRGVQARWLFLGKIPFLDWAIEEIERRSAKDRIILHKPVPHEEVAVRVRAAKIGIIPLPDLPKFQFNIPTKLFEFMVLGMPTVLSDLSPSRPFIEQSGAGVLVPPADFARYAEEIVKLLESPETCSQMGVSGRKKVLSEWNWDAQAKTLLSLYNSL